MDSDRFTRHFDFLVTDVARLVRYAVDLRMSDIGLTRSQWWLLAFLQRDEGKTQAELAEILDIGRPSLGALLDRLEAKKWIERKPDKKDRRVKRIYLTPRAWPVIHAMNALGTELREENLGCLTPAEQEQLIDLLLRVKERALRTYRREALRHLLPRNSDSADGNLPLAVEKGETDSAGRSSEAEVVPENRIRG